MFDLEIIQEIKKVEKSNDYIFSTKSKNNNYYGRFWLSRLKIDINISDEEYDKIESYLRVRVANDTDQDEKAIPGFYECSENIQKHSHEMCHLFQVLTTKYLQNLSVILFNKDKSDTVVFLKYLGDYQDKYTLTEHESIQDVLENKSFARECFTQENIDSINEANNNYLNFQKNEFKKEGINCEDIYEGMAHYFSMYSSDYPEKDFCELPSSYYKAYELFLSSSKINEELNHIRTVNLLFLYTCYFSLQSTSQKEVVNTFFILSKKAYYYYAQLDIYSLEYACYTDDDIKGKLKELNIYEWFTNVETNQLIEILSFISVINLMSQELNIKHDITIEKSSIIEDLLKIAHQELVLFDDDISLFLLCLSPSYLKKFIDVKRMIEELKYDLEIKKISKLEEDQFFDFILDMRNMFIREKSVWCCPKDGYISDREIILKCNNKGSIISLLQAFLKKDIEQMICLGY